MKAIKKFIKDEPLASLIFGGLFINMILFVTGVLVMPENIYKKAIFDSSLHVFHLIVISYMVITIFWILICNIILKKRRKIK